MTAEAVIELLSLLATLVIAVGTTYLAYSAVVFTAKPKLTVETVPARPSYHARHTVDLDLQITNVGHWHSSPAATNMRAYVNVDDACTPVGASLGLNHETDDQHIDRHVYVGKGMGIGKRSRCVVVNGIYVVHGENPELIRVRMTTPTEPGSYEGWVVLLAAEGDCGVHRFRFDVDDRTTS